MRDIIGFFRNFSAAAAVFSVSVLSVYSDAEVFTDTVILKNKKELRNVKAVHTSDFWTVVSSEGEKIFYRQDEVLEVKKADSKKEEKHKIHLTGYGIWSSYLGELDWEKAGQKCKSVNMRLPDRTELLLAFRSGAYESWKKDNGRLWFWTSEEFQRISVKAEEKRSVPAEEKPEDQAEKGSIREIKRIYNVDIFNGGVFLRDSDTLNSVRCIR